jgi:RND family efflux transporter MFP subunit
MILIMLSVLSACTSSTESEEIEESYIAVEIESLQKSQLYIENTFSGKVTSDKGVYVIPPIVAEVLSVNVKVGELVKKDDILFVLDGENIQKQVDQAYTAYSSALASFEMSSEQISAAKDSFERTKELYEQGVVSKAQYEQAELAASDKALSAAAKGVEQARLAYNQALSALDNATVKAPIEGTVTSVDIIKGQMALNSQPAVTIMDLENMSVEINVSENIINKLYVGQEVSLKIDSANIDVDAEIFSISSSVNQVTSLYPVKIIVENNGNIKAGMFAQVVINTDIRDNVFSVPGDAILNKGGRDIVFVENDGKAIEKEITTGLDTGSRIEIISGLDEGDRIIIKGQNYISNDSKVKAVRGE